MPFVCLHLALVDNLSYWPVESGRFRISRPMSRASSSQNFEPTLGRPHRVLCVDPDPTPYPPFSSISCGKCSSPCCGNFRRFSPENLRESFENFSWTFSQDFRKIFFRTFPFKILRDLVGAAPGPGRRSSPVQLPYFQGAPRGAHPRGVGVENFIFQKKLKN